MAKAKKTGRKAIYPYDEETAETFLERFAAGERIIDICDKIGVPVYCIRHYWRATHPDFSERYMVARETYIERQKDKMQKICDFIDKDVIDQADPKLAIPLVRAKEVQLNNLVRLLTWQAPEYSEKNSKTFLDITGFSKADTKGKLNLIYQHLDSKQITIDDATKLLPLIELEIKIIDIIDLKNELYAEIKKLKDKLGIKDEK